MPPKDDFEEDLSCTLSYIKDLKKPKTNLKAASKSTKSTEKVTSGLPRKVQTQKTSLYKTPENSANGLHRSKPDSYKATSIIYSDKQPHKPLFFRDDIFEHIKAEFSKTNRVSTSSDTFATKIFQCTFQAGFPVDMFLNELKTRLSCNLIFFDTINYPSVSDLETKLKFLISASKGLGSSGKESIVVFDIIPSADFSDTKKQISEIIKRFLVSKSRQTPVLIVNQTTISYWNQVSSLIPKQMPVPSSNISLLAAEKLSILAHDIDQRIDKYHVTALSKIYQSFMEIYNLLKYCPDELNRFISQGSDKIDPENDTMTFRRRYFASSVQRLERYEPFNIVPFTGGNMLDITFSVYISKEYNPSFISDYISLCTSKKYGADVLFFALKKLDDYVFLRQSDEWGHMIPYRMKKSLNGNIRSGNIFAESLPKLRSQSITECLIREASNHMETL